MKKLVLIILAAFLATTSFAGVSVYIVAHPDDWQLFMGSDAYRDMKLAQSNPQNRVVIVHILTGHAGKNTAFWKKREDAAMSSVLSAVSSGKTGTALSYNTYYLSLPGGNGKHKVILKEYLGTNVAALFFRLPDGCQKPSSGCGGSTIDQTLENLYNGHYKDMPSMDGMTTYKNWRDLQVTLSNALYPYYNHNNIYFPGHRLAIHYQDYDTNLNTGDNFDHTYAGRLAVDATGIFCPDYFAHLDYVTGGMPPNLNNNNIKREAGLYSAYNITMVSSGYFSDWDSNTPTDHCRWLDKNYYRTWNSGGNCTPQKKISATVQDSVDTQKFFYAGKIYPDTLDVIVPDFYRDMLKNISIDTSADNNSLKISPVPADRSVKVDVLSEGIYQSPARVDIIDNSGTLKRSVLSGELDVSDLQPDVYFIKVTTVDGRTLYGKIIKN